MRFYTFLLQDIVLPSVPTLIVWLLALLFPLILNQFRSKQIVLKKSTLTTIWILFWLFLINVVSYITEIRPDYIKLSSSFCDIPPQEIFHTHVVSAIINFRNLIFFPLTFFLSQRFYRYLFPRWGKIVLVIILVISLFLISFIFASPSTLAYYNIFFDEYFEKEHNSQESSIKNAWKSFGITDAGSKEDFVRLLFIPSFSPKEGIVFSKDSIIIYQDISKDSIRMKCTNSHFVTKVIRDSNYVKLIWNELLSFKIDKMKSLRQKEIMYIDGTTIIIETNIGKNRNTFSFFLTKYNDKRYNRLAELYFELRKEYYY